MQIADVASFAQHDYFPVSAEIMDDENLIPKAFLCHVTIYQVSGFSRRKAAIYVHLDYFQTFYEFGPFIN
jgi:hypothetical protein